MTERPLYRQVAGRTTGPYAPAKLRPLVKDGRVSPLDRFSYDGTTWASAQEFPELMRDPPAVVSAMQESFDASVIVDDAVDDFVTPNSDAAVELDEDDESTQRLMKAVVWVTGIGGGLILLTLMLTLLSSLFGTAGRTMPKPAAAAAGNPVAAAAVQPAVEPDEAITADEPAVEPAAEPTDQAGTPGE